jgi:alpha-glucosidase
MFRDSGWPSVVMANHDQPRQASRLAPRADARTSDEVARAAAVLNLTLRGTPFIYYAEEIGARDVPVPWDEIIDPPARRGGRVVRRLIPWWNRDQARSPLPWGGGGPNGGFTTGRPWLRMAPDVDTRNVATQDADPGSVLNAYRRLMWLRRRHPALQVGTYRQVPTRSRDVLVYERAAADETIIVALNFGSVERSFGIRTSRRWRMLFDTHAPAAAESPQISEGGELTLRPRQAVVLIGA